MDVALVNNPEKISHSGVLHIGISDHSLIYVCRKISFVKNDPKFVESRNFKNYIQRDFNQDLYHALFNLNWEINDPNMFWENFQTTFNYVADIHAPLRSRKVRNRKAPWLTDVIKKSMNRRDYLKKKAIKTNSTACHNAYKSLRNEINKKIMYAKRDYYTDCVDRNRNNTKQMWKHINQLVNKNSRSTNISVLQIDEQVITENETIADLFNEYFTDIGPNLSNLITETNTDFKRYMKFKTQHKFNFENININEVLNALEKLKTSKSTGHDNIPAKPLKDASDAVAPFLVFIFNTSLKHGIFPDDLKTARISPIHKSGDKKIRGNYRPISILSVIAKLFEKLVCAQLNPFLTENNILSSCQSGFRKNYSTASALLANTDSWLLNMDAGMINGVLFLDLCKAFDTVDHGILLSKLSIYGIQNKALDWFKSYLHNRTQYCRVNSATSSTRKIRCGVPQGSNLGPLLFLLYVNDLPNCLDKSCPAMYADDTNLTVCSDSINNLEEALNSEMKNIYQWLLSNKLTLNIEKTEYMIIGTRQRLAKIQENTTVSCGGKLWKQVYSKKTLGVLIDDNLCWNEQIDNISKKVSKGIGMLRRAKPFVSFETLKYIYQALVQPSFDYCSMVWGNCGEDSKEKLQRLQNRAARVITGDTYEIRSTDILKKLNWKTLEERR